MLIESGVPFLFLQNKIFRHLVREELRSQLPTRNSIVEIIIPSLYKDGMEELKNDLQNLHGVCLTVDGWTSSDYRSSYIGMTVHYIKDNMLLSRVLELKEYNTGHTSENIKNMLLESIENWGLSKYAPFPIVTDNAPNVIKAVKDSGMWVVGCACHKLSLIFCDIVKQSQYFSDLLDKMKQISISFKCKMQYKTLSNEICDEYDLRKLSFLRDVPTRWFSKYRLLERVMQMVDTINSIALSNEKTEYFITENEKDMSKFFLEVVKPLVELEEIFSSENKPTLSVVIPLVIALIKKEKELIKKIEFGDFSCAKSVTIPTDIYLTQCQHRMIVEQKFFADGEATLLQKNFVSSIITEVQRRFFEGENDIRKKDYYVVAAFLNPWSRMYLDSDTERFAEECIKQNSIDDEEQNLRLESVPTKYSVIDYMNKIKEVSPKCTIEQQIQSYKCTDIPQADLFESTLDFWENQKLSFPQLYKMAMKYLCCLASSTPSERLFSSASFYYSPKRTRIGGGVLEKLCFLRSMYSNEDIDWTYFDMETE